MAMTYGLAPNYGCCTANFNQGWPKFANMLVYATQDGGAAVAVFAPAVAKLESGSTVEIVTDYPFGDTVTIIIKNKIKNKNMPLYVRIPGWADNATLNGTQVPQSTMHKVSCPPGTSSWVLELNPRIRMESWDHTDAAGTSNGTAYSVHRGALMYSLPLGLNFTETKHYFDESNDYTIEPTTPWAYALAADPANPSASLQFVQSEVKAGDMNAPFNHSGWPTRIKATVHALSSEQWGEYYVNNVSTNAALPPPASPACRGKGKQKCGPPIHVELVPHGGTDLRMGELPVA